MRLYDKRFWILVIGIIHFSNYCFASYQEPEILIFEGDTIPIFVLPAGKMPKQYIEKLYQILDSDFSSSLGLWRGYQGVWQVSNNKLYLVGFANCKKPGLLNYIFQDKCIENKVFASWATLDIILPKGKILRWGIFEKIYLKEEILHIKKGKIVKRELVDNYVPVKNGISRLQSSMKDFYESPFDVIKGQDWEKINEKYDCDDIYSIIIGSDGRVKSVNPSYEDCEKCAKMIKKWLQCLQYDIIKKHGKPYEEEILLKLFYNTDTKMLENWMKYD